MFSFLHFNQYDHHVSIQGGGENFCATNKHLPQKLKKNILVIWSNCWSIHPNQSYKKKKKVML